MGLSYEYHYTIVQAVIKCVNDTFYKITSEALLVLQNLVKIIRPLGNSTVINNNN